MTKSDLIKEVIALQKKLESLYFSEGKSEEINKAARDARARLDILREIRETLFFKEVLEDGEK